MPAPRLDGLISWSELLERVAYDPSTGIFRWRSVAKTSPLQVGDRVGCQDKIGRWVTKLSGRQYIMSRLAWFYMTGNWPTSLIDHINTDHTDDRWGNLREATYKQNCGNTSRHCDNKSGYKGVVWCKFTKKWRGQINNRGKNIILGYSDDPAKAHEFYLDAARKYFGEYARAA